MDQKEHEPRAARSFFEQAYADYLTAIRQIWSDYLATSHEICLSYVSSLERLASDSANQHREAEKNYHAALLGDYRTKEQCSEGAYDHYMQAILQSWDFEKALQESKYAHNAYREALINCVDPTSIEQAQNAYREQLKLAWTPQIAASCIDAYNGHIQTLANAWVVAQRYVTQAHRVYLEALQTAWAAIDTSDIDDECLAAIGKDMTSVALQPALGTAVWQSSGPAFSKVAGKT